ncbi:SurA N-terminal domain-containing protein [Pseudaestuariivita rosea]|uniref:SurA N-terminal domain-containing protein n=1 Tax=Pseudaestuariivita rosea TaxID=2763263 RepID=UPI001ABAE193|nr:SurA N-terminal domain-containing protein [Pseudaestuariivita rosea]
MGKGKISKLFVWILFGLLALGLAGFSTGGFGNRFGSVASVGSKDVDGNTYARTLQDEMTAYARQTGRALPFETVLAEGIDQIVLQRLIATRALDHETDRLGLSIGDDEVRNRVQTFRDFLDQNGNFDRETYRLLLQRRGQTEAEFEASLREDAAREILQLAVVGGLDVSDRYIDTFYNYLAERRNFSWIALTADNLDAPVGVPDDATLQSYYDANPDEFTLPETKRITYAWLTPDMLQDDIDLDEEVLRGLYDDRISEFVMPERRLVERLVFGSEDEAAAAKARLDAGELTFPELVEERDLTLDVIDLGDRTQAELGDAGEAIFALEEAGQVTNPLPSPLGPALYRMNAILSAQETSFEEVRDDLGAEIIADTARRQISDQFLTLQELLASGATLEELASESDMELGTIEWYPGITDDIAAYTAFRAAALQLDEGDFPEILELEDGGIFAMRLEEIIAPRVQPLADVRGDAIRSWQSAETLSRLDALADDLMTRLEAGENISDLGFPVNVEQDITRDFSLPNAPVDTVLQVFEMTRDERRKIESDGQIVVVELDEILVPDEDNPDIAALRGVIESAGLQSLQQDLFLAFTRQVQDDLQPTINPTTITSIHANFQ